MGGGGRMFPKINASKKHDPPYGNRSEKGDPPYGNVSEKSDPPHQTRAIPVQVSTGIHDV